MRRSNRYLLMIYAVLTAAISTTLFILVLAPERWDRVVGRLQLLSGQFWKRVVLLIVFGLLVLLSILTLIYVIFGKRFRAARTRNTEYGVIDISNTALENIALNSARSAQAGIKSAKARIASDRNQHLEVALYVVLYSDVEIPLQMQKIQERVRKDLEHYSGIPVGDVGVRVNRVELVGAKVEK